MTYVLKVCQEKNVLTWTEAIELDGDWDGVVSMTTYTLLNLS